MTRLLVCMFLCLATAGVSSAEQHDALARARALFNQGQYEPALAAAEEARKGEERADSADLIVARIYLERYRTSTSSEDLDEARLRLRRLDPSLFNGLERVEFLVGLGQTLFFDGSMGAAADIFYSVLTGPEYVPPASRERVLDWWATALDEEAKPRPAIERQGIYERIRSRMSDELSVRPGNAAAAYWTAAAARAQGDLQAAWDAAQAAWVRASLAGDRGQKLRDDIDMLVDKVILTELARVVAQPRDVLAAEWERFKERWARQ